MKVKCRRRITGRKVWGTDMASFGYTAIDDAGREIKGSMEAETAEKVKNELKGQGLLPLSVEEQSMLTKDVNIQIGGKPKVRDLSVFCRQFVSMTRAGVTILEALKLLVEQTENKRLKAAVYEVRISVEKGETLAAAIAEHPQEFPELMVHMVAAGEASGKLDIALDRIATQFEKSAKTQGMVKKAMIYPIIVAIVAVGVVIVMLTTIIPSYTAMFADLGTDLPGITKAVIAASDFVKGYWFIIVPVVVAVIVGFKVFGATNTGKHVFGKISMKIPAMKNLTIKSASSHMARTLSTLLAAGVPLPEATDIVADTMSNIWYKEALKDAKDQITIGVPLSRPLEESGLFPPMVYHMIRIGEEVGNTEEMLTKLADYYDEEVELATQSLMAAMEPMIILVLAGIVGTLVGAVIAPMGTMYSALDNM